MKQKLWHTVCLILICTQAYSQKNTTLPSVDLTWKILQHGYNNTAETLSELVITNPSAQLNFPSKGWTIYFNAGNPRNAKHDALLLKVDQINGDFFKITPQKDFKGIPAKKSVSIQILSRNLKNITDFSKGFYIVYDEHPNQPISLKVKDVSVVDDSKQQKEIAKQAFEQNKLIELLKIDDIPPILPSPVSYERLAGSFPLNGATKIITAAKFQKEAQLLKAELSKVMTVAPAIASTGTQNIISIQEKAITSNEGYELEISATHINIYASNPAGAFYAIQTLKNLLPVQSWKTKQNSITVAALRIKDEPRFQHRAFMMDIARNYLPKAQILKVLDALSLYKINVFHLHFNDDEGWRIEIDGLPELTEIGSKRGHTLTEETHLFPSYGSGPSVSNRSGSGHLSKADFIEILKYATARHIKVIPEYETPGHARAAIKAMDARYHRLMKAGKPAEAKQYLLRDLEDQSVYTSVQGFNDNVINPAQPSVYTFMGKIIDETIAMYAAAGAPLHTIHFGGDEVPNGVWEKSPAVKALLEKDKSIENVDELWHYYFKNVNALLKAKNLYLSGWEEIGLKKQLVNGRKRMVLDTRFVNENFHTDVWNNLGGNEDLAYKLANAGYKVVLTNVTNMYLDLAYSKDYNEIGQYWGGYVDVDKPFNFIPLDYYKNQTEDQSGKPLPKGHYDGVDKLNENAKANIVGLQAPLWAEVLLNEERFEYLFLPKVMGLAERSWAVNPAWATETNAKTSKALYQKDWSSFVHRIGKTELPKLNHYAGGFEYRIPTAGYTVTDNKVTANVLYPGMVIRYTTDGSTPTVKSKLYSSALPYQDNIKLRVFNNEGRGGRTVRVIK